MLLDSHRHYWMTFEENVVPVLLDKVAYSSKRKMSNGVIKVLTKEKFFRPLKVFQPRLVPPREIAFSCPKENHA